MLMHRWAKRITVTAHVTVPGLTNVKARVVAAFRHLLRRPRQPALRALRCIAEGQPIEVLDVGSALGQGVADIRHLRQDAKVVAFEPNPMYAAHLRRRFSRDSNVRIEQIALSEVPGVFTLYVPVYNYTALPDLGTSSRADASRWLRSRLIGYRDESLFIAEVTCQASSIDAMRLAPDVIVIDTRCDASSVLSGGEATLRNGQPSVLLERAVLAESTRATLRDLGYRSYRIESARPVACTMDETCDLLVSRPHSTSASFMQWLQRGD